LIADTNIIIKVNNFFLKILKKEARMEMTPLSSNWHYVFWYKNITVTVVSLILPFMCIVYWVSTTFKVTQQRSRTTSYELSENTTRTRNTPNHANAAMMLNARRVLTRGIKN